MDGLTIGGLLACISLVATLCSVASFYLGRRKAAQDQGKEDGSLKTNIQYIKDTIRDTTKTLDALSLKIDNQRQQQEDDYRKLLVQLTKLEASYQSLSSRVGNAEKEIAQYHHHHS